MSQEKGTVLNPGSRDINNHFTLCLFLADDIFYVYTQAHIHLPRDKCDNCKNAFIS